MQIACGAGGTTCSDSHYGGYLVSKSRLAYSLGICLAALKRIAW
jgi:hypothetical protein